MTSMNATLNRYKEAIAADSELLHCHRKNIQNFKALSQRNQLQREINSASKTLLRLTKHASEMRSLLADSSHENQSVESFLSTIFVKIEEFDKELKQILADFTSEAPAASELQDTPATGEQLQLLVVDDMALKAKEKISASDVKDLEKDIVELHETFVEFDKLVHNQDIQLSAVQGTIENAGRNVEAGTKNLSVALKLKAATVPLVGAAIGGIVGGPVGLVLGAKIGVAAGLTLGVSGGVAGGIVAKRQLTKHMENSENQEWNESMPSPSHTQVQNPSFSSRIKNVFSFNKTKDS